MTDDQFREFLASVQAGFQQIDGRFDANREHFDAAIADQNAKIAQIHAMQGEQGAYIAAAKAEAAAAVAQATKRWDWMLATAQQGIGYATGAAIIGAIGWLIWWLTSPWRK
jgi:hypothetical protein